MVTGSNDTTVAVLLPLSAPVAVPQWASITASPIAALPVSPEISNDTHDPSAGTATVLVVSAVSGNRSLPSGLVNTMVALGPPAQAVLTRIRHFVLERCAG